MRTNSRIEWWWRLGLGWPGLSPASSLAVAGARVSSGSTLRWPGRLVRGTYVLYVATAHESENREGETVRWLTAVAAGVEAGSGKAGRQQFDDGDPRRPTMKKRSGTAF